MLEPGYNEKLENGQGWKASVQIIHIHSLTCCCVTTGQADSWMSFPCKAALLDAHSCHTAQTESELFETFVLHQQQLCMHSCLLLLLEPLHPLLSSGCFLNCVLMFASWDVWLGANDPLVIRFNCKVIVESKVMLLSHCFHATCFRSPAFFEWLKKETMKNEPHANAMLTKQNIIVNHICYYQVIIFWYI